MAEKQKPKFSWVRKLIKRNSASNGLLSLNGNGNGSAGTGRPAQMPETLTNNGHCNMDGSISVTTGTPSAGSPGDFSYSRPSVASTSESGSIELQEESLPEPFVDSDSQTGYGYDGKSVSNSSTGLSRNRSIGADSYLSAETNSSYSRPSRIQIVDSRPTRTEALKADAAAKSESDGSTTNTNTNNNTAANTKHDLAKSDTDSVLSQRPSISSNKRKSNSNFTVPSIAETSATTVSPSLSDNGFGFGAGANGGGAGSSSTSTPAATSLMHVQSLNVDTASVITIASSSKRHGRRSSFDTNASMLALAPESIISRTGSIESYPTAPAKSISSGYRFSDEE